MQTPGWYLRDRLMRRAILGAMAAGFALGLLATGAHLSIPYFVVLLCGAAYSILLGPERRSYVESATVAGTLGILVWGMTLPFVDGAGIALSATVMRANFPALIAWVLFGILFGLLLNLSQRVAAFSLGREAKAALPAGRVRRIVILGGGFAGMKAAEHLEARLRNDPSTSVTLVSQTNALLFTPMLAEIAGGSLEPSHISTPLRSSLETTAFVRARVTGVDSVNRLVTLDATESTDGTRPLALEYDYLVIALGSESNFMGMERVAHVALRFRSLLDASRIRNRVIEKFELADREPDKEARRTMLRFIVAGGGFAGVELAGALNDFVRGISINYHNVQPDELEVVLVHSRDRILPELTHTLARYAREKMEERGVIFRLRTHVKDANPSTVFLDDGPIEAKTLIWTAGSTPHNLLKSLSFAKDEKGALLVEPTLAAQGHENVWALGDCAAVKDARTGLQSPPTAQFAIRQAKTVAQNICRTLKGESQGFFHFKSLGSLCVIGHQTACAELAVPFSQRRSVKFAGLAAWMLWRGIYLTKLPGLERKIRVLLNWTLELFFPRDIVQTIDVG